MKRLFVGFFLFFVAFAQTAAAEYELVSRNRAGGVVSLTAQPCPVGGDPAKEFRLVKATSKNSMVIGCWKLAGDSVVVLWLDDYSLKTYELSSFVPVKLGD